MQSESWVMIEVPEGIAIHDEGFRNVHYLNSTAAAIYLLCEKPITQDALVKSITELFVLSPAEQPGIREFIGSLLKIQVLKSS